MNHQKIGNFIRSLRKEKNLTQKEVAEKLEITDRAISRWERGIGCPDISLLEDLSNILGVTVLELLKGEHLNNEKLTNQNLIESIQFGKKNIMILIQKISDFVVIFIIVGIIFFIILTNFKSIKIIHKDYDYTSYIEERKHLITTPPTISIEKLIEEFNIKIEKVLSNQGRYTEEEYSTIKTHLLLLKENLTVQKNEEYLKKTSYSFKDLTSFYLEHQNIVTPFVDHKDLYSIIISYEPSLSDQLIFYSNKENSIRESYFYFLLFLEQPYYISSNLPYNGYIPNPFDIIEHIYSKELQLIDDLIKAGDIK